MTTMDGHAVSTSSPEIKLRGDFTISVGNILYLLEQTSEVRLSLNRSSCSDGLLLKLEIDGYTIAL